MPAKNHYRGVRASHLALTAMTRFSLNGVNKSTGAKTNTIETIG